MSAAAANQNVQRLAGRLLAVLREEVASQERVIALLERQEAEMTSPASDGFRQATGELEAELQRAPHRVQKREKALRGLADAYGISAGALTLTSLVERLESEANSQAQAAAIATERDRIRAGAHVVRRRLRRVGAMVRMHREVTRDLVQLLLGTGEGGEDVRTGGTLIDAEV